MKKILLPIDGSPRSLRTIQEIKQSYDPKETEITILLVTPEPRPHKMTDDNDEVKPMPDHDEIKSVDENDAEVSRQLLASFARMMPEYKVDTALRFGNPGPEIIGFAKEGGFDSILMTRSSRGCTQKMGSVSTYIVRNASFIDITVLKGI